ncbi:MAG: RsmB/NOP family class I SAM-dependent RNA methyltransferase [Desulfurococcaceae archaeon]
MARRPEAPEILKDIRVEPSREAEELARKFGYMPYMVQRYIDALGEGEALRLLEAFERPPRPVVRTNTVRVEPVDLAKRLESKGFELREIPWSPGSFWVMRSPASPSLGATHEYLKGYYYVHRDASSLLPAPLLLHGYEGDVLDACAAPGGKATHMAQLLWPRGIVHANDIALYRLKSLVGHVARMGLANVAVYWGDARELHERVGRRFRRILLDAPCSGEGRISVDPGRKKRTSQEGLAALVSREIELLASLLRALEPGGLLAYVTCSVAPEEDEYVVSWAVREGLAEVVGAPREVALPPGASGGLREFRGLKFAEGVENCVRLWPHRTGLFGYFVCLLRRRG